MIQGVFSGRHEQLPVMGVLAIVTIIVVGGCGSGALEEGERQASRQADHFVSPHWPADLSDLVVKLSEGLEQQPTGVASDPELVDWIQWTSEIAADTDLTESEWNPIDQQVRRLTDQLRREREIWTTTTQDLLRRLLEQLKASEGMLQSRRSPFLPTNIQDD